MCGARVAGGRRGSGGVRRSSCGSGGAASASDDRNLALGRLLDGHEQGLEIFLHGAAVVVTFPPYRHFAVDNAPSVP